MAFDEQEKEIIRAGMFSNKPRAEVEAAIANYRRGGGQTVQAEKPLANKITEILGLGGLTEYLGKVGAMAPGMHQEGSEAFLEKPTAREGVGAGFQVASIVAPGGAGLGRAATIPARMATGALAGNVSGTLYGYGKSIQEGGTIEDIGKEGLSSGLFGTGAGAFAEGVLAGVPALGRGVKGKVGEVTKNASDAILDTAKNFKTRIQTYIGAKHVEPQFEESAKRLFLEGTERLKDPVSVYDNYLTSAKAATGDIKKDPPISVVGEKIGDAFNSVVGKRKAVGAALGEELKKVGGIKTNIDNVFTDFETQLADSGIAFDAAKRKLMVSRTSKIAGDDVGLLQNYITELNKLGSKPTVAEIDAFISRMANEITYYKSAKGILETTNAERLVKGNLAKLRSQLTPKATGNEALSKYAQLKSAYSDLSNFIDEGAGFLGKMTQSGDFARDASLAKSAVQSVLNNGKKDWLIRLEGLTDYPALDDSVIALQAMKDAGDFRGSSLLDLLSPGNIPLSKMGAAQKILNYAAEKGGQVVAGTPEEQTRAFLRSLKPESIPKGKGATPQTTEVDYEKSILESAKLLNVKNPETVSKDLGNLYKKAEQVKPVIDKMITDVANELNGAIPLTAPLKGNLKTGFDPGRAVEKFTEKILTEGKGRISDLARNTLLVNSLSDAAKSLKLLTGKGARLDAGKNFFDTPTYLGYRGLNLRYGDVAEIQVQIPEIMFYKQALKDKGGLREMVGDKIYGEIEKAMTAIGIKPGRAHEIFEVARKLEQKAIKEGRYKKTDSGNEIYDWTPEEETIIKPLQAESVKGFETAIKLAENRANNMGK